MLGRRSMVGAALLLVGGVLWAEEPVTIRMWTNKRPEERETLREVLGAFQRANPGIRVVELYYETEDLRDRYINFALGKKGPDLIYGPSDAIGPLAVMKILRPLDDVISEPLKQALASDAFVTFRGATYQIAPTVGNHLMLIFNQALVSSPPKTFEALIEMGRAFSRDVNGDGVVDRFGLVWNYIEPYFMIPFLSGYGGWVMDEADRPTLNTPEMVKALRFIIDLRDRFRIIPSECDYETADALFKEGKALFIINGPWALPGYTQAGVKFGIGKIPKLPGERRWPTPMKSALGYSVNPNISQAKLVEVMKLVAFLVDEESQRLSLERDRTLPTHRAVMRAFEKRGDAVTRAILKCRKGSRSMPVHPNMRVIWDQMRGPYQKAIYGKATPEEAAAEMQRNAVLAIAKMNRQ